MFKRWLVIAGGLATLSFGLQAQAGPTSFSFSFGPISGSGMLTVVPNVPPATDPDPLCGTSGHNACRHDPPGAYRVTSISGTFSDPLLGLSNVAITGLVPTDPADERDPVFDPLVPASLSFVGSSTDPSQYFSYDNLFYPNGAPVVCDFPFTGTLLDPFGMAFTIAGGDTVDLWGDGDLNFGPLTYGIGVLSFDAASGTYTKLVNQFAGANFAVPEPDSVWTFGAGLLLLAGFALRSGSRRRGRAAT